MSRLFNLPFFLLNFMACMGESVQKYSGVQDFSLETSTFEELGSEFINFASNCYQHSEIDCLFNWVQHLNLEITLS